ncbi:hypothetical protein AKO1_007325 [Acrasis kona]|uniref:MIP18 family-like domain-containing protein n=1 Tax=Acrasis kona TaxID=1008807 RepID=A0AAW2YT15_9EUKA
MQIDEIDVFDAIRDVKDPEYPHTLQDLNVVFEEGIQVVQPNGQIPGVITVKITPTVKHCSLVSHISLCLRLRLVRYFGPQTMDQYKVDIFVTEGSHDQQDEVNKQMNDKERVAAAVEIPELMQLIEECIKELNV